MKKLIFCIVLVSAFIGAFDLAMAKEAKFEPINSSQALLEFIKDGQEKGYFPQKIVQFLGEPRIMQAIYRLQDVDFDFCRGCDLTKRG